MGPNTVLMDMGPYDRHKVVAYSISTLSFFYKKIISSVQVWAVKCSEKLDPSLISKE